MNARRRVAVVFGGSGFIGQYVVQRLARRDYVVRVITRDPEGARPLMTQGLVGQIVPLAADPFDDLALARALEDATVVVNLIGILFERREGDFARVHGALPGRIAEGCAKAGVQRLVQVSAIGADATSPSLYGRSKAEGEAAVLAAFPRATILRPSIVFGREDAFFNRFAGMARLLPVLPIVGSNTRFQPVYVGDVADAVMAALDREDVFGRTYELGGPRVATFKALMEEMLEVVGRRRRVVELPRGLAEFQAKVFERLPNPPLTRDQLLLLGRDNVVGDGMPGLHELGIEPTTLESILPVYLARFRVGGERKTRPAL
ncbi:complex I NDUFA9 subunit family protein [Roseomonas sp. CCTCC AB2023176]|uniref:complex I NDUFA9 subunit family protein n=1 Tax=Roseomonas sp. CCTCC AB2023176 TaxID=3342640 RepID=UPI0035DB0656